MQEGLTVIRRIDWRVKCHSLRRPFPNNRVSPLSYDEVLRRYCGIEGELWPDLTEKATFKLTNGLAKLEELNSVLQYFTLLHSELAQHVLFCRRSSRRVDSYLESQGFSFCGYDYGLWINEHTNYSFSALFHEILMGQYPELKEFTRCLNENYLFPDDEAIRAFLVDRTRLVLEQQDLEESTNENVLETIAVYRWLATSRSSMK